MYPAQRCYHVCNLLAKLLFKNSLPILDSFLFNLEGNKLTITASDAETRLVTSVDVMNAQERTFRGFGKNLARPVEGVARTAADF